MGNYAVRLKANKEFVCICGADRLDDLPWLIDEVVDPSVCEYRKISGPWALFASKPGAPAIPDLREESQCMENVLSALNQGSESLWRVFEQEAKWRDVGPITIPMGTE